MQSVGVSAWRKGEWANGREGDAAMRRCSTPVGRKTRRAPSSGLRQLAGRAGFEPRCEILPCGGFQDLW